VSILEPEAIVRTLETPPTWRFIAYLCLGFPSEDNSAPELARRGWEHADPRATTIHLR
jgi:5,6-dimethylbenzimidazole synthase